MEFNEEIKIAREKMNLSQTEVANAIGVSLRMYQYYEEGKRKPKYATIALLQEVLNLNQQVELNEPSEPTYLEKRRKAKTQSKGPFMVPLIPVKAQAGYVRAVDQERFMDTLEHFALPPGVNPQGAVWRWWEIEGDSMEPEYYNRDVVLTSQVHQMDWENIRNFHAYVIVTEERVLFKKVYCKNELEWVLISVNEDQYPQQLLPVEFIKEVWVMRRHVRARMPTTKMYEIKV
jgi:phage repressor protein C with HTH and peptisase S24 domain